MTSFVLDFDFPEYEEVVVKLAAQEAEEFLLSDLIRLLFHDLHAEGKLGTLLSEFEMNIKYEETRGIWRPTSLHRCMARHVYKVFKTPTQRAMHSPEQQWDFDRGHVFEAWVMAYIKKLVGRFGVTRVETNVEIFDPVSGLGGRADFILWRNGSAYLGEIKSKDEPFAFTKLQSITYWHKMQLNDYMGASLNSEDLPAIRAGWVIYVGPQFRGEERCPSCKGGTKVGTNIRDFFWRFDPAAWAETLKEIQLMQMFLDDPEQIAPKASLPSMLCPGCPYEPICGAQISPAHAADIKYEKFHQRGDG